MTAALKLSDVTDLRTGRALTVEEMEAAGYRAAAIKGAIAKLREAEAKLKLVNESGLQGRTWREVKLQLKAGDYYNPGVAITIDIPFGVVQQQAVYAVEAARREVIKLGGTP